MQNFPKDLSQGVVGKVGRGGKREISLRTGLRQVVQRADNAIQRIQRYPAQEQSTI